MYGFLSVKGWWEIISWFCRNGNYDTAGDSGCLPRGMWGKTVKGADSKKKLSKHAFPTRSSETLDADKDDSNLHSSTSVSSLSLCVLTHLRWVLPHKSRCLLLYYNMILASVVITLLEAEKHQLPPLQPLACV